MSDDETVTILQVVDKRGRAVFDGAGNWRQFQIVQDGEHEEARGDVFTLYRLTGKALHWRYGLVVVAETGEVVRRDASIELANRWR